MNAKALIVCMAFLVWAQISWRWYTHDIKGFYAAEHRLFQDLPLDSTPAMNAEMDEVSEISRLTLYEDDVVTIFFPYKTIDAQFERELENDLSALGILSPRDAQRYVISGHTDAKGSEAYNLALGRERAEYIASLLNKAGVNEQSLTILSYGESKPLVAHDSPGAEKMNRRVEIRLIHNN